MSGFATLQTMTRGNVMMLIGGALFKSHVHMPGITECLKILLHFPGGASSAFKLLFSPLKHLKS